MEIYEKPATLSVAGFIGTPNMNLIDVTVDSYEMVGSFAPEEAR
ncbi:hypothetical protein [Neorhizobium lilium]|nr:hypothetical protein [Neorhizobium lilium]